MCVRDKLFHTMTLPLFYGLRHTISSRLPTVFYGVILPGRHHAIPVPAYPSASMEKGNLPTYTILWLINFK